MALQRKDLTSPVDLAHEGRSGPERTRRPVYVDLMPPCNDACPAGEDIQGWLALAQAGRFEEAWQRLLQDNPLPAVHGRVCYHPCESACNRAQIDEAVSVHEVERFLGDRARERGWTPRREGGPWGRRVLVVGAGPCGLSAAYHLARLGHEVEVREAGPGPGGMLRCGIPDYRLPRDVLADEVRRIEELGVRFTFDRPVRDVLRERAEGGFDAVLLAVGARLGQRTGIPAMDAGRMLDALASLRDVGEGAPPRLGRRVASFGGGKVAIDAARTARRLGHEPLIIYRRDRARLPAQPEDADEALAAGVRVRWLRATEALGEGRVLVEVMALDADGRPRPTGELEALAADSMILAFGQDVDAPLLRDVPGLSFAADGALLVGGDQSTGHPGIFAGGDLVPSARTVTSAVGHGKRAARHIDAYLRGEGPERPPRPPLCTRDKLHLWLITDAARRQQAQLLGAERLRGFGAVRRGLPESEALFEARRCLSCGNCFECDGCLGACPEGAIVKLGSRYRFDYARCTGCAVCFDQCPCHAIEMVPEGSP